MPCTDSTVPALQSAAATRTAAAVPASPSPRLCLHSIAAAAVGIRREFLHSPQYRCEPLSAQLGCDLPLKVECVNALRSFKGRGADWFLQQWLARGGRGALVCASAGKATSWARRAISAQNLTAAVMAPFPASP